MAHWTYTYYTINCPVTRHLYTHIYYKNKPTARNVNSVRPKKSKNRFQPHRAIGFFFSFLITLKQLYCQREFISVRPFPSCGLRLFLNEKKYTHIAAPI